MQNPHPFLRLSRCANCKYSGNKTIDESKNQYISCAFYDNDLYFERGEIDFCERWELDHVYGTILERILVEEEARTKIRKGFTKAMTFQYHEKDKVQP